MDTPSVTKARSPLMQLTVFATWRCKSAATHAPKFDYNTKYKYYYNEILECSWFSGGMWDALTFTTIGMTVAAAAV
eukprot:7805341-Pyramimonas_sp.AAC.1